MRIFIRSIFAIILIITPFYAHALISLELTRGIAGAIPIAVVPFGIDGRTPSQITSRIIENDLQNSGRFKVYGENNIKNFPTTVSEINASYFNSLGTDNIVIGKVTALPDNQYEINFQLIDLVKAKASSNLSKDAVALTFKYVVPEQQLRSVSHHISDVIYKHLTGTRGIFSTRLAYVVVKRGPNVPTKYILEVSDQDGFNPKPLLISTDPIMSPSWSPNGKQVAYVSFENRKASIYIEDVATGQRQLISQSPGINGAPSWSPDGRKLALVLSKSGTPNLYTLDLITKQITQLTNDFYINTEPAFSPDGKSLVFTSNRSGNPQIYQLNLSSRQISRVTYEGRYNARASFTPDGNHLVVLNQQAGFFNIGTLNLDNGVFRVLTNSGNDTESPSAAPNGSMILFGTRHNGRNVLGMVATDGSVQIRLPARDGEVQDPAWSPFLS